MWITNIRVGSEQSVFGPTGEIVFQLDTTTGHVNNMQAERRIRVPRTEHELIFNSFEEMALGEDDLVFVANSILPYDMKVSNDLWTLSPIIKFDDRRKGEEDSILCYLTIDIGEFTPVIYKLSPNIHVRETYKRRVRRGKLIPGMLLEIIPTNDDPNPKGTIDLIGYAPTNDAPKFKQLHFDLERVWDEEYSSAGIRTSYQQTSAVDMDASLLKVAKMKYRDGETPCGFYLSGPIATKYYCGIMNPDSANRIINEYLEKIGLKGLEFVYVQLSSKEKPNDKGLLEETINTLHACVEKDKIRAITVIGNHYLREREVRKSGLQCVLSLRNGILRNPITK